MSKLSRVLHKIFGINATFSAQMGKFGSFKNGSPEFATNIADIQSLPNWETGLFDSTIGNGAPLKEDFNSAFHHSSRQLGYLFQEGIPEWDSETNYYIGSIVKYSNVLYIAAADNLNDAPPSASWNYLLREDKHVFTDNSGSWINSTIDTPTLVTNLSASFTSKGGVVEVQLETDPSNSDLGYISASAPSGGTISAKIGLYIDDVLAGLHEIVLITDSSMTSFHLPASSIKFSKFKIGTHTYSIKAWPIQTGSAIAFENVVMHIKEV